MRFERALDSCDDFRGIAHPVQRRVAEDGVEFAVEIERFTVHYAGVQTEFSRGVNLRCTGIDTDDVASHRGELRGEHAVAAAEVQDALASARREQFNHRRAEVGDETGVAGVAFRIPGLCLYHFGSASRYRISLPVFLIGAVS